MHFDNLLIDELDALTSVSKHLSFFKTIIDKSDIEKNSKVALLTQTQAIESRAMDPYLYMAVIGEASTGKSTFINALLGDVILETHALVMTTITQTRIQYGRQKAISFTYLPFENGESRQEYHFTNEDEPITLSEIPSIRNLSLRQLIRACTTDSEVVGHLDNLTLYYPSDFLKSGICIIDTPGADATDETHAQIAREAIAFSDAAIIITPAKQIVSSTFVQIIQDKLDLLPLLHRCIILVAGMDMIREKERERLMQSVHKRLQQKLNPPVMPPIMPVSAQSVVDTFSGGEPIVRNLIDRLEWQKQFEITKEALFAQLKRQRALTISEKLLRLIDQLFASLEMHLEAQWKQYNAKRRAMDIAIIPDLQAFANAQHQECNDKLLPLTNTTFVQTAIIVDEHHDKLIRKIEKSVDAADSLDALKNYIKDVLPNQVAQQQNALQAGLGSYFEVLRNEARSLNLKFDERFSEAYDRLRALERQGHDDQTNPQLALATDRLADIVNTSNAFSGPSFGQKATGAFIGGIIGAIVLPGVGWLITAWLGQKIVAWLGPSLDKRKEQLMDELRSQIQHQFISAKADIGDGVKEYGLRLQTTLDEHIDNHVHHYQQTVQQMRREQQQHAMQLQSQEKQLEKDQEQLQRHRQDIADKLSSLQTIAI